MNIHWEDRRAHRTVMTVAVLAPLAAGALLSQFRESITAATAVLVFVALVVAMAATGSRAAGVTAAVSSAASFDFFLTQPYGTFAITNSDDIEVAVLLLLIGLAVSEIALWGRRQQARASRRQGYLDGVLRIAGMATDAQITPDTIASHAADEIVVVLDIDSARFASGEIHDPRVPRLDHDGRVTRSGHTVNVERDGMPTDSEIALPVRHDGVTTGYFMLTASSRIARPSIEQRQVAVLLADQAALEPRHQARNREETATE